MYLPIAVQKQSQINSAVSQVVAQLSPSVQSISYQIAQDWSGQWAIFFRVVLSDDAARSRLRQVANNVEWRLAEHLDFNALGVFPYHNFRSESEQAASREEAWA